MLELVALASEALVANRNHARVLHALLALLLADLSAVRQPRAEISSCVLSLVDFSQPLLIQAINSMKLVRFVPLKRHFVVVVVVVVVVIVVVVDVVVDQILSFTFSACRRPTKRPRIFSIRPQILA